MIEIVLIDSEESEQNTLVGFTQVASDFAVDSFDDKLAMLEEYDNFSTDGDLSMEMMLESDVTVTGA
jgi:hypothetical protein